MKNTETEILKNMHPKYFYNADMQFLLEPFQFIRYLTNQYFLIPEGFFEFDNKNIPFLADEKRNMNKKEIYRNNNLEDQTFSAKIEKRHSVLCFNEFKFIFLVT